MADEVVVEMGGGGFFHNLRGMGRFSNSSRLPPRGSQASPSWREIGLAAGVAGCVVCGVRGFGWLVLPTVGGPQSRSMFAKSENMPDFHSVI